MDQGNVKRIRTAGLYYIIPWFFLTATTQAAFRLPSTVTPSIYNLLLTPILEANNYTGKVDINIVISINATGNDLSSISLHKDSSVSVTSSSIIVTAANGGGNTTVANTTYDQLNQVYTINLQSPLTAGATYTLSIPFSGVLRSDRTGLHVGSYTYKTKTRYYLASNFYPIYARLAFPCFDEPQLKSVFTVTIVRSESQFAVSNMNVSTSTKTGSTYQDVFQPTPSISVHSLSIFVGDQSSMVSQDTPLDTGTNMTLWKISGSAVDFSEQPFSSFQSFLEQVLKVNHPLGYLKIFVLPDLKYEAYSGYGVIFFRQDIVQPYAGSTTKSTIKFSLLVFDQLVRQYVRDFVTPAWWSDVWLTEGIAMYLKYFGLSFIIKQINTDQLLAVNTRQEGLLLDTTGYGNYPLVESDIDSSSRILRAVSDDLKKSKGAALLYMIDQSFSGAATVTLIQEYFVKSQLTITTDGFMKSISTNYTDFTGMDAWFNTTGYPTVSVSRNNSKITLSQKATNGLVNTTTASTVWNVPISYTSTSRPISEWMKTVPKVWQDSSILNISIDDNSSNWVVLNIKSTGFYRVQYDSKNLQQILNQLKTNSGRIDVINHASIVDDIMALSTVGSVDYKTSLNFLKETSSHTRYSAWVSTINSLNYLKLCLYSNSGYTKFQTYVKKLLQYPYANVGFQGDSSETVNITLFRSLILPWACEFGVGDCVQKSTEIVQSLVTAEKGVRAAVNYDLDMVMCTGFRNLNSAVFDTLFTYYKTNQSLPAAQYLLSCGIGCATRGNLNAVLSAIISGDIHTEDVENVFASTYSLIENIDTVVNFIVNNATVIHQKYGIEFLLRHLKGIGKNVYSEYHVQKLLTLNSTTLPSSVMSEVSSLAAVANNRIVWATNNVAVMSKALDAANKAAGIATYNAFLLFVTLFITFIFKVNNI